MTITDRNAAPEPLGNGHKEIPWQEIMGMRNKLAHEYFGVDLDIVWQSIHEGINPLEGRREGSTFDT